MRLLPALAAALATSTLLLSTGTARAYTLINIAGGGVSEELFQVAGDWTVLTGATNEGTMCVAERVYDGVSLRIGMDHGPQWQLAVDVPGNEGETFSMEIDGRAVGASIDAAAGEWRISWINLGVWEALKAGDTLVVDVGRASVDFDLAGSASALSLVEQCAGSATAAPAPVNPAPATATASGGGALGECPDPRIFRSHDDAGSATIEFTYKISSGIDLEVHWVDQNGQSMFLEPFNAAKPTVTLTTTPGHVFILRDALGRCYGGAYSVQPGPNSYLVE